MLPSLFKVGPLEIRTYGLMLAIAFLLGITISANRAKKRGENPDNIYFFAYFLVFFSILGARLFYVVFHLDEFAGRWIYTVLPFQEDGTIGIAGLMILGGVVFGFITAVIFFRIKKLDFFTYGDIIAPALPLGIFFGRLGCFFNGCCFGDVCHHAWGVVFPPESPAGAVMGNLPLHPTQLYESFFNLLLFFIILFIEMKWKPISNIKGSLLSIFLIGYGVERIIVDLFRHYESQMFVLPGIEINQIISFFMIVLGIYIIIKNKKSVKTTQ
ncbi:MAG: prolipoprotein diacylglyceryl transferase [Calditrichia bacterium]